MVGKSIDKEVDKEVGSEADMPYSLQLSKAAQKIVAKWKKSNPALYKKLSILLNEIIDHPRIGTGHPEPLLNGNGTIYSRRISAHDRIIYDIRDDIVVVIILQIEGHYADK